MLHDWTETQKAFVKIIPVPPAVAAGMHPEPIHASNGLHP
jgi:hypothetical protein